MCGAECFSEVVRDQAVLHSLYISSADNHLCVCMCVGGGAPVCVFDESRAAEHMLNTTTTSLLPITAAASDY